MGFTGPSLYEYADEIAEAAEYLLDHLFPRKVFIGCKECHTRTCDCDSGVQAVRALREKVDAYKLWQRGEEVDE